MYYIVEVIHSTKTKTISREEDRDYALRQARNHSLKTGMIVEVLNESGKTIERIQSWDDR